jgi:hypothetical protein
MRGCRRVGAGSPPPADGPATTAKGLSRRPTKDAPRQGRPQGRGAEFDVRLPPRGREQPRRARTSSPTRRGSRCRRRTTGRWRPPSLRPGGAPGAQFPARLAGRPRSWRGALRGAARVTEQHNLSSRLQIHTHRTQHAAHAVPRVIGTRTQRGAAVRGRTWWKCGGGHNPTVRNQAFGVRRTEGVILTQRARLRADPRP